MRFAAPPPLQRVQDSSFGELHFKLIELHGPPSVLVNEEGDIVHLSEHAGRYLRMAAASRLTICSKSFIPISISIAARRCWPRARAISAERSAQSAGHARRRAA